MDMHDPPHPGEILRDMYLAPFDITVTAAAERLGVSSQTLADVLNGRNSVSQDLAIRLGKAFPNTDIRFWLRLQMQYDTWHAEQCAEEVEVTEFSAHAGTTAA